MLWKSKLTPDSRIKLLIALGPLSGLAFVLSVYIGRLQDPNLDFLLGFLIGFSIVGNLAYIYATTQFLRKK